MVELSPAAWLWAKPRRSHLLKLELPATSPKGPGAGRKDETKEPGLVEPSGRDLTEGSGMDVEMAAAGAEVDGE